MDPSQLRSPAISRNGRDSLTNHVVTDVDAIKRVGICSLCGPVHVRPNGSNVLKGGQVQFRWRCANKVTRAGIPVVLPYSDRTHCERCGFQAEDACQIDIHHRNGDRLDNRAENFEFLCANCHRLQTKMERRSGASHFPRGQTCLPSL